MLRSLIACSLLLAAHFSFANALEKPDNPKVVPLREHKESTSIILTGKPHTPDPKKILRYAFEIAETGFDPAQISDWYSSIVNEQIFDNPLTYDYLARPATLKPNVLVRMPDISADGLTYTLEVKPGIYFNDDAAFNGKKRELVAADIAYSIKRLFDAKTKSPNQYLMATLIVGMDEFAERQNKANKFDYDAPIAGFEYVSRYVLKIKLVAPYYNFMYRLASTNCAAIVAREVVEKYGDDIMAHPVGTGPYKLTMWKRGNRISLEPNPNFREEYFDAKPAPDDAYRQAILKANKGKRLPMIGKIEISIIEEDQPRWLAFLNGEHDFIDKVPNDFSNIAFPNGKVSKRLTKQGMQIDQVAAMEITYAYFGMKHPQVGGYSPEKVALRRAMILGYNNAEEVSVVLKNQGVEAKSPIGPGAFGYDENFRTAASDYNPAQARALLDLYGYIDLDGDGYREAPDGAKFVLVQGSAPDQRSKKYDELWKKCMDAIGIDIQFKKAKWPDLLKESKAGKLMSWRLGWGGMYPDGEAFYVMLYGPNGGQANHSRFDLPAFNDLFEKAKATTPGPERADMYKQMNRLAAVYAPWKMGAHRLVTDMSYPWVIGHTRHPVFRAAWKYVDIDLGKKVE